MGLSLHYSGSFNANASLSEMIEEVKDIAEIYKWEYTIYEKQLPSSNLGKTTYDNNIYGINFTPPECESVSLCFLSNGRISSPINLLAFGNATDKKEKDYLYMVSVKTQYAGSDVHKLIIHLFKYLSKKYFQEFMVTDEGQYWETGDEKLLEENFNRYNELINIVGATFENNPIKSDESIEEYFERILKQIEKKRN